MRPADAYADLTARFRRHALVGEAAAMLHWDWAAMMPAGGAARRTEQLAELELLSHEMMADPVLGDLLETAEGAGLDGWEAANLRAMRRRWVHATALPADLVEALATSTAECEMVWRDAREAGDYAAFAAAFEPVLGQVRDKAAALGEALGCEAYDALIDQFDPGARQAEVDPLFDELQEFLPGILDAVLARQAVEPAPDAGPLALEETAQAALAHETMATLGFDFAHGRLDTSHHPFCGGVSQDVRITTRYDMADLSTGLMGVLHETGHALYERGLPGDWRDQPVGEACGMAVHESQSLLFEMQACRSLAFFRYLAPQIRDAVGAPEGAQGYGAEALHRRAIHVSPGLIRVDADEVTYPFHIFLRYDLEKSLVAGDLAVSDLPDAWDEGMQRWLGLVPAHPRDGVMQDIHWPTGTIGYFPSYTVGAVMAAQLFEAAIRDLADLPEQLEAGNFAPLLAWLREAIHAQGSRLSRAELVVAATGAPLGTEAFHSHLKRRYLG